MASLAAALGMARVRIAAQSDFTFDDKFPGGRDDAGDQAPDRDQSQILTAGVSPGEQGALLLQAWMMGEVTGSVPLDPTWAPFLSQVGNYMFYVPVDWRMSESTDPTPTDFSDGFITSTRAMAPDESAAFLVYDVGLLPYDYALDDFANETIRNLAGGDAFEIIAQQSRLFWENGVGMSIATRSDDGVAALQVFRSQLPDYSTGGIFTSFSTTIQIGGAEQFDELTRTAFLPMLAHLQRFSGGGGDDPTPTPTPIGG